MAKQIYDIHLRVQVDTNISKDSPSLWHWDCALGIPRVQTDEDFPEEGEAVKLLSCMPLPVILAEPQEQQEEQEEHTPPTTNLDGN
jgi:hypothetical protein